jgi:hypothetical protein
VNHSLIRLALLGVWLLAWSGAALAVTCEECRDMEKQKAALGQQIGDEAKKIQEAMDKKQFPQALEIRNRVNEMRKRVNEITLRVEKECRDACRPDVVKAAECGRIRQEIASLDSSNLPPADQEKVDRLYRDLLRCNEDLVQLQKTRH